MEAVWVTADGGRTQQLEAQLALIQNHSITQQGEARLYPGYWTTKRIWKEAFTGLILTVCTVMILRTQILTCVWFFPGAEVQVWNEGVGTREHVLRFLSAHEGVSRNGGDVGVVTDDA